MAQDIEIETEWRTVTTKTYAFTGTQLEAILRGKISPPPGASVTFQVDSRAEPGDSWLPSVSVRIVIEKTVSQPVGETDA